MQLRRGFRSKGFWMAVLLQLFALTYVHMDAGLFWQDPWAYFRGGDFYYTFFISTELGLSWLTIPMVAMLPMGFVFTDDKQSGYINLVLYRQRKRGYVIHRALAACLTACAAVLFALSLYTVFIALTTTWTSGTTGWQELAQASPYGWRATSAYFYVLVLECFGRLLLSSVIWVLFTLSISNIWSNRAFIAVMVIGLGLFMDSYLPSRLGVSNTLSYLQIPPCGTDQPLALSLGKQLVYLGIAAGAFTLSVYFRFSSRLRLWVITFVRKHRLHLPQNQFILFSTSCFKGNRIKRFVAELWCFTTFQTMICGVVIGGFAVALTNSGQRAYFSVGDILLECYGGMYWFDPQVDFAAIARWTLLLLPPMMGIALNLEREMGERALVTMNRYGSVHKWWVYKSLALVAYAVLCIAIMAATTALVAYATGAQGFAVYGEDSDGFSVQRTDVIWMALALFTCHVLMLTQLQILIHVVSNDMRVAVLCYIVPVVALLVMMSNVDHVANMWNPYSWGMLLRTNIFAGNGYFFETGDGLNEWLPQCSLQFGNVLGWQALLGTVLYAIHTIAVPFAKISSRKKRT